MKKSSEKELAEYNEKNWRSAYLAYNEKVYDVSSSFLWKDKVYCVLHDAGVDLTYSFNKAPHSSEFLEKFSIVGTIDGH